MGFFFKIMNGSRPHLKQLFEKNHKKRRSLDIKLVKIGFFSQKHFISLIITKFISQCVTIALCGKNYCVPMGPLRPLHFRLYGEVAKANVRKRENATAKREDESAKYYYRPRFRLI